MANSAQTQEQTDEQAGQSRPNGQMSGHILWHRTSDTGKPVTPRGRAAHPWK